MSGVFAVLRRFAYGEIDELAEELVVEERYGALSFVGNDGRLVSAVPQRCQHVCDAVVGTGIALAVGAVILLELFR